MRSRLLLAVAAWLFGALAATFGSMLAVSHLAHGLLGDGTEQLSSADVRSDLAAYGGQAAGTGAPAPVRQSTAAAPRRATSAKAEQPVPATEGTLLVSRAGSAMADCEPAGAYLQYWSPAQGYEADDVYRGPAARASLVFEAGSTGERMVVTCVGSTPQERLSSTSDDNSDDDGRGPDE